MDKTYTTKAIILNRRDFSESDRVFSLYTDSYGKLEVIATSARKSTSKMAKFLEPLMEIDLLLVKSRSYDRIAEVGLIDNFEKLKNDRDKWALGCYCLEIIDKLVKVGFSQNEIFILLKDVLNRLKEDGDKNLITFYIWRLLSKLGYCPQLVNCIGCGKKSSLEDYFSFNINKGGLICKKCLQYDSANVSVSLRVLSLLNQKPVEGLTNLRKLDINIDESRELKQIVGMSLNYHLDYNLKTINFFKYLK